MALLLFWKKEAVNSGQVESLGASHETREADAVTMRQFSNLDPRNEAFIQRFSDPCDLLRIARCAIYQAVDCHGLALSRDWQDSISSLESTARHDLSPPSHRLSVLFYYISTTRRHASSLY